MNEWKCRRVQETYCGLIWRLCHLHLKGGREPFQWDRCGVVWLMSQVNNMHIKNRQVLNFCKIAIKVVKSYIHSTEFEIKLLNTFIFSIFLRSFSFLGFSVSACWYSSKACIKESLSLRSQRLFAFWHIFRKASFVLLRTFSFKHHAYF